MHVQQPLGWVSLKNIPRTAESRDQSGVQHSLAKRLVPPWTWNAMCSLPSRDACARCHACALPGWPSNYLTTQSLASALDHTSCAKPEHCNLDQLYARRRTYTVA